MGKMNLGERAVIRRGIERLFDEHPEFAGRSALEAVMGKVDE